MYGKFEIFNSFNHFLNLFRGGDEISRIGIIKNSYIGEHKVEYIKVHVPCTSVHE